MELLIMPAGLSLLLSAATLGERMIMTVAAATNYKIYFCKRKTVQSGKTPLQTVSETVFVFAWGLPPN